MRTSDVVVPIVSITAIIVLFATLATNGHRHPAPWPNVPPARRTLYVVTTPGCVPCARLKAAMLSPEVTLELARFDVVQVDGVAPLCLGRLAGYPTLAVCEGDAVLSRRSGAMTPSALVAWLRAY